jgi:hypothetical protein
MMPSFELMSGTRIANRFRGAPRAADPSIDSSLLEIAFKKRRWESNPLEAVDHRYRGGAPDSRLAVRLQR